MSLAEGECQAATEKVTMRGTMVQKRFAMVFSRAHALSLCVDVG